MLEAALRDYVADPARSQKLLKGIDRVLLIATKGDDKDAISAMKLLLDRVMPTMPIKEAEEATRTDKRLLIVIQTNPNATVPVEVIEGDYKEISNE